ncbi:MAG TPA: M64 family metallopeptidase [Opitutaceae bacterium]|nr:M64 family metallopeptidase [Opitutaceae bacterium]
MPITAIRFGLPVDTGSFDAADIHLVRGTAGESSPDLIEKLWVQIANGSWSMLKSFQETPEGTDVEVTFQPMFKATESTAEWSNFGIHIKKKTGQIRVEKNPAPDPAPRNFLVEAIVTKNGAGAAPASITPAFIRIHVHSSVKSIWVTPSLLSVRRAEPAGAARELTMYQPTVRAEFDDRCVGDVTDSKSISVTPSDWFVATWVSIPPTAPETVPPFEYTVTTSANWGHRSTTGKVEILPQWAREPNPPLVEFIDGNPKLFDGTVKPEKVPNVLFVACGWSDNDAQGFKDITQDIVQAVRTKPMFQPFGYLATSMAFWRVMLPKQDAGISVTSEVCQFDSEGYLYAKNIAPPVRPSNEVSKWDHWDLQYLVGLPLHDDLLLIKDTETGYFISSADTLRDRPAEKLDFSKLIARWKLLVRPNAAQNLNLLTAKTLHAWASLSDRTFIDEVNNFPALQVGDAPAAMAESPDNLEMHGRRGSTRIIDQFFDRISAAPIGNNAPIVLGTPAPNNNIGRLWSADPTTNPDFAFDNRRFIFYLGNSEIGRANAPSSGMVSRVTLGNPRGMDLYFRGQPVKRDPNRNALVADLPSPSRALVLDETWTTFGHELAHTFGVGDEYVEFARDYSAAESSLDEFANCTLAATVLDPTTGAVRFDRIKWNWHRIQRSSVITGPITKLDIDRFTVPIPTTSVPWFSVGDAVVLRKRERLKPLGLAPKVSPELKVVDVSPNRDLLTIRAAVAGLDLSAFTPGSLIFTPVPAPATVQPPRPYLTLVSPAAERMMTVIGGALNGKACDVNAQLDAGSGAQVADAATLPDNLKPFAKPELVGVYHGAARYACSIFRPTGNCMMREHELDSARFCRVCAYTLIEQIDPQKHWWLDRDYQKDYPL